MKFTGNQGLNFELSQSKRNFQIYVHNFRNLTVLQLMKQGKENLGLDMSTSVFT